MNTNILNKWKFNKNFQKELEHFRGKIVTRFPPEPSGYLHIGHVKAILINYVVTKKYDGKFIFRLDDTNPDNETKEYKDAISQDVLKLGIIPDKISNSSDYFDELINFADYLVNNGLAYIDNREQSIIKEERMNRIENIFRNSPIDKNKKLWTDMKNGKSGSILRIKMDMKNENGALRDPTIYRSNNHNVFPTYDFCCPIVDSIEGVTHVFRSTEFVDRDAQYKWLLKLLNLRCPKLYGYGKVTFNDTVMSKRKIKSLINDGKLNGWDDPRLLTIRGAFRRGLCLEAIIDFSASMGFSKAEVSMTQQKLWVLNKKHIDKISTRYTVLPINNIKLVKVHQANDTFIDFENCKEWAKIRKYPSFGTRKIFYNSEILISNDDMLSFSNNEEITLMNWGNMIVHKDDYCYLKLHLDGDFKTTEKKVLWLCHRLETPCTSVIVKTYKDSIAPCQIEEYIGEPDMKNIKKGDYIQLLRKGYYICDQAWSNDKSLILIEIPYETQVQKKIKMNT